ncbi:Gfo/Idh/MocA family oxidoreductase [Streptococcus pneumoniae]|nr:Gfo/Idh/MocA family oxidoreductase [Streptococcus pneumoniae]
MVKYGVVGAGYFGAELARYMQKNDGAEITLLYDPDNAEAIAEELGAKVASSLDELVSSDEVDCVIVATPNNLHKEPVIKAAQHGKNVFCEKPIALSYQDCREMVDACKENNVTFMAGHIMNFFMVFIMQKNSLIKELSETFYIVIQLVMVGKNNNRQYHGKKFVKNQVVTCITTSMNWIAFNSLWGACLKL